MDNVAVPAGESYELMFYAGGGPYRGSCCSLAKEHSGVPRSGPGDWHYHCHIIPHVKHGMWGIFRVFEPGAEKLDGGQALPE